MQSVSIYAIYYITLQYVTPSLNFVISCYIIFFAQNYIMQPRVTPDLRKKNYISLRYITLNITLYCVELNYLYVTLRYTLRYVALLYKKKRTHVGIFSITERNSMKIFDYFSPFYKNQSLRISVDAICMRRAQLISVKCQLWSWHRIWRDPRFYWQLELQTSGAAVDRERWKSYETILCLFIYAAFCITHSAWSSRRKCYAYSSRCRNVGQRSRFRL